MKNIENIQPSIWMVKKINSSILKRKSNVDSITVGYISFLFWISFTHPHVFFLNFYFKQDPQFKKSIWKMEYLGVVAFQSQLIIHRFIILSPNQVARSFFCRWVNVRGLSTINVAE